MENATTEREKRETLDYWGPVLGSIQIIQVQGVENLQSTGFRSSDQYVWSASSQSASLMTALSLALHKELKYNRRAEVASPQIGMAEKNNWEGEEKTEGGKLV